MRRWIGDGGVFLSEYHAVVEGGPLEKDLPMMMMRRDGLSYLLPKDSLDIVDIAFLNPHHHVSLLGLNKHGHARRCDARQASILSYHAQKLSLLSVEKDPVLGSKYLRCLSREEHRLFI